MELHLRSVQWFHPGSQPAYVNIFYKTIRRCNLKDVYIRLVSCLYIWRGTIIHICHKKCLSGGLLQAPQGNLTGPGFVAMPPLNNKHKINRFWVVKAKRHLDVDIVFWWYN
jgi:hypothetical protein